MANYEQACIDDLITKIKTVAGFTEKTFYVYDFQALLQDSEGLSFPNVGVVYDGTFSQGVPGKKGLSSVLQCTLYLADTAEARNKTVIMTLLDNIRNTIISDQTRSPTGHPWEFVEEVPNPFMDEVYLYSQKWETKVMLTSNPV